MDGRRSQGRHDRGPAVAPSGLTAYLPFLQGPHRARSTSSAAICGLPLEYAPRTRSIYSDLGIHAPRLHSRGRASRGATASRARRVQQIPRRRLDAQFRALAGLPHARAARDSTRREAGATARRRRSRIRGAAGCWSARCTTRTRGRSAARRVTPACSARVAAVGAFARAVLATLDGQPMLAQDRHACGDSSSRPAFQAARARLGWDTMLPTSSCGTRLSPTVDRSHRIHRHVAVDRLGARPLHRAADEPRPPDARERAMRRLRPQRARRGRSKPSIGASDDDGSDGGRSCRPNGASRRPIEGDGHRVRSPGRSRRRPAHVGDLGVEAAAAGKSDVRCRGPAAARHVGARVVCRVRHGLPGVCAPPGPPGIGRARHAAAGTVGGGEHEVPLVVAGLPLVDADRCFLALAVDAHDAAADAPVAPVKLLRHPARRDPLAIGAATARRAARRPRPPGRSGCLAGRLRPVASGSWPDGLRRRRSRRTLCW